MDLEDGYSYNYTTPELDGAVYKGPVDTTQPPELVNFVTAGIRGYDPHAPAPVVCPRVLFNC